MVARFKQWVLWIALWLARWASRTPTTYQEAVVIGMQKAGLNSADAGNLDFNLKATGKLQEVLHHACEFLNQQHTLRTVGDVVRHLEKGS